MIKGYNVHRLEVTDKQQCAFFVYLQEAIDYANCADLHWNEFQRKANPDHTDKRCAMISVSLEPRRLPKGDYKHLLAETTQLIKELMREASVQSNSKNPVDVSGDRIADACKGVQVSPEKEI